MKLPASSNISPTSVAGVKGSVNDHGLFFGREENNRLSLFNFLTILREWGTGFRENADNRRRDPFKRHETSRRLKYFDVVTRAWCLGVVMVRRVLCLRESHQRARTRSSAGSAESCEQSSGTYVRGNNVAFCQNVIAYFCVTIRPKCGRASRTVNVGRPVRIAASANI